jgi:hypothetical protein
MAEKRIFGRFKRRLPVKFGKAALDGRGMSGNISATGLSVLANKVHAKGLQLLIEITLPGGGQAQSQVEVMWSQPAPPGTQGLVLGSMGLRFLGAPPENYYSFLIECDEAERKAKPPE